MHSRKVVSSIVTAITRANRHEWSALVAEIRDSQESHTALHSFYYPRIENAFKVLPDRVIDQLAGEMRDAESSGDSRERVANHYFQMVVSELLRRAAISVRRSGW